MKIQVSHGAPRSDSAGDVNWFVVSPLPGEVKDNGFAKITNEMAVESLKGAGRSVYELDVEPWVRS